MQSLPVVAQTPYRAALLVFSLVLTATGCASDPGRERLRVSTPIPDAAPDEVLAAAEAVLGREFPRLSVDRRARMIVAEPVEYAASGESGTARDLYGGRSRMRRSAEFVTEQRGGATRAWLRIDIHRRDTERRTAMRPAARRLDDRPGYTPIEEDAATTESQNAVWTYVGRDRRLERALLDEISATFAPPPTTQPAAVADEL